MGRWKFWMFRCKIKTINILYFLLYLYFPEINDVLRHIHHSKIEVTPFKWCLQMEMALNMSKLMI